MWTTTLDLQAEIEDLRGRLADLEADQEALLEEAERIEAGEADTDSPEERLAEIEAEFDDLEAARTSVTGFVRALEKVVEEWNGSEFEIVELSAGTVRRIKDEVAEKSDGEAYRSGYHEIRVVEESVVSAPPGAPSTLDTKTGEEEPDPKEYPNRVFSWLYEKINAWNTVGEYDMGNSSLQERLDERRGESTPTADVPDPEPAKMSDAAVQREAARQAEENGSHAQEQMEETPNQPSST